MDIKILIAMHKPYWHPDDPVYMPIHVGKKGKASIGLPGDDTGDNISDRNPAYCELTGVYWAWKNLKVDSVGLVPYRRYFPHKGFFLRSILEKRKDILTGKDWQKILSSHPIVVADKRKYRIETNEAHYLHAHPREQLDVALKIKRKKYPEYEKGWNILMNRTWAHMFNMFVMRKDYFDEWCAWWFSVMFEVEKQVDLSEYPKPEQRWVIDELLLDVWLETKGYPYYECNVDYFEKQNWLKKGWSFIGRKLGSK